MNAITLFLVLGGSVALMGLVYVIRSPTELMSLLRNPREHLFGKSNYRGGDNTGLLYDAIENDGYYTPEVPEGFFPNDGRSGNPYKENTYVVIINYDGEELWGMTSDEVQWNYGHKYQRDEVIGHRPMTDSEIAEHEAILARTK